MSTISRSSHGSSSNLADFTAELKIGVEICRAVLHADPASGEGAKLMVKAKKLSGEVQMNIEAKEAVLIETKSSR
jgi:hypothetical protein